MKKKIFAIVMALVMVAAFIVPASALDLGDLGGLFGGSSSTPPADEDTSDTDDDSAASGLTDISIEDILASEAFQEIMATEGAIDITNVVMDLVLQFGSFDIKEMGKEKLMGLVQNLINQVGGMIMDTKTNVEVFADNPVDIVDNLFGLNVGEVLTTAPKDEDDPDDMDIGLGDVDGDGRVTAADARLVLRRAAELIVFTPEQEWLADVDDDGKITAADARLILRVASELDSFDD